MLESLKTENLEYQKLSQDEQQRRGILGRLIGTVADFAAPTRNGRHYSEELWEKVFADPIMKERIENGVCYGELGHPLDREETDIEKVAVCMAEVPKKDKNGKLTAVFDILSTPNGKILKTLCDYGSTLGVSSRGSGDTFMGRDGNEEVDPDSYTCQGFDIVLIPAVKSARLQYVTESLDTKKSLKESLQDVVNNASEEDRKIMEETLDNLDLDDSLTEQINFEAKPFNYTISYGGKSFPVNAAVVIIPNALHTPNGQVMEASIHCLDESGREINFKSVEEAQEWIDTLGRDARIEVRRSDIYAVPKGVEDFDECLAEDKEIFYVIKDKHGNQLSRPTPDDSELWDRVEDRDPDGKRGLKVVVYTGESLTEKLNPYDLDLVLKKMKAYLEEWEEVHDKDYSEAWVTPEEIKNLEKVASYLHIIENEKPDLLEDIENSDVSLDIDEVTDDSAVVDDEAIFEELQTVLKQRQEAEQKVIELNEKLSVCYAKEESVNNRVTSLKAQIEKLTESSNQVAALKTKVSKLKEDLNLKEQELEKLNKRISTGVNARKALTEDVSSKQDTITKLNEELKTSSNTIQSLTTQVEDLKKDLQLNKNSYSKKLEKSNKLVENYKKITTNVINRYIESQALKLGISSNEIKNKLPESYNIDDIDSICEDLQSYKLNMSKLPFSTMQSVKVTPKSINAESLLPKGAEDDFVDAQLLSLLEKK